MALDTLQKIFENISQRLAALEAAGPGKQTVDSVFGRTGEVTAQPGDYSASDITTEWPTKNVQQVLEDFTTRLENLEYETQPGQFVKSFNGRTGTVIPADGDYNAHEITFGEDSDVETQLNSILARLTALEAKPEPEPYTLPTASATELGGIKIGQGLEIDGEGVVSATGGGTGTGAVDSVFGRTGAVTAQAGDYDASQITYGKTANLETELDLLFNRVENLEDNPIGNIPLLKEYYFKSDGENGDGTQGNPYGPSQWPGVIGDQLGQYIFHFLDSVELPSTQMTKFYARYVDDSVDGNAGITNPNLTGAHANFSGLDVTCTGPITDSFIKFQGQSTVYNSVSLKGESTNNQLYFQFCEITLATTGVEGKITGSFVVLDNSLAHNTVTFEKCVISLRGNSPKLAQFVDCTFVGEGGSGGGGDYTLPVATTTTLGGVLAPPTEPAFRNPVYLDGDGRISWQSPNEVELFYSASGKETATGNQDDPIPWDVFKQIYSTPINSYVLNLNSNILACDISLPKPIKFKSTTYYAVHFTANNSGANVMMDSTGAYFEAPSTENGKFHITNSNSNTVQITFSKNTAISDCHFDITGPKITVACNATAYFYSCDLEFNDITFASNATAVFANSTIRLNNTSFPTNCRFTGCFIELVGTATAPAQSVMTDCVVVPQEIPTVEPYVLPVASANTLGGVKVGAGINLGTDGTISVTPSSSDGWLPNNYNMTIDLSGIHNTATDEILLKIREAVLNGTKNLRLHVVDTATISFPSNIQFTTVGINIYIYFEKDVVLGISGFPVIGSSIEISGNALGTSTDSNICNLGGTHTGCSFYVHNKPLTITGSQNCNFFYSYSGNNSLTTNGSTIRLESCAITSGSIRNSIVMAKNNTLVSATTTNTAIINP